MNRPKGVRGKRVADESLTPGVRDLLTELRGDLGRYGWTIHSEQRGSQLSFELQNPLSPVESGWIFDPERPTSELRTELMEHLKTESEFARTRTATPPRRRRRLLGGIRWAATSYGWPDPVFHQVIDTLRHFRVLASDEWEWLNAVGPRVLKPDLERKWQEHMREHESQRRDDR